MSNRDFKLDFIGNKIWTDGKTAYKEADFVVISAPRNYGSEFVIELVMSVTSEALG